MRVLAGDIGGTKTLLAVADVDDGRVRIRHQCRYESRSYSGFAPMLADFLQPARHIDPIDLRGGCLGVAGPVYGAPPRQRADVTNLPWSVDAAALAAAHGLPRLDLLNDFEAIAHALPALEDSELCVLQTGEADASGALAVVGAGTGLGMALVDRRAEVFTVRPTEGGHAGFAPGDAEQSALWSFVQNRRGRVSIEHLLSGNGLLEITAFLLERSAGSPSATLGAALASADPPAAITAAALSGAEPLADAALDLFVRIYGAVAGDLALLSLPRGGLYIAGGIAPRILPRLQSGGFMAAFLDKAPMQALLRSIPVRVVLNPEAGLIGAARVAAAQAHDQASSAER